MSAARTFADALYEAAREAGALEAVAADLAAFSAAVEGSAALAGALADPLLDAPARGRLVAALAEDAHPLIANFLQVLNDHDRIGHVREIAAEFADRLRSEEGRLEVHAVTAVPMPDDLRDAIARQVGERTGRTVELTSSVDPDIIGGLVLRVEDAQVDASVRGRLEALGRALRGTSVEPSLVADD